LRACRSKTALALATGHERVKLIYLFYLSYIMETKKHFTKKWEVSIIEIENSIGKKYKVTRRIPEMSVAETKVFRSKQDAKKQFEEWLE